MWDTALAAVGYSVVVLVGVAVFLIVGVSMTAYTIEARRRLLETLAGSIYERVPYDARAAMETVWNAPRWYEPRGWFRRGPRPPSSLSTKEWQRVRDLLRVLREVTGEVDTDLDPDRVVAALLGCSGQSDRVHDLNRKRRADGEEALRRIREKIDRSGHDASVLVYRGRRWVREEGLRLRWAAFREIVVPGIDRLLDAAARSGGRYTIVGTAVGGALLFILGSGPRVDVLAYVGGGAVLGGLAGLAMAVFRLCRRVVVAYWPRERALVRLSRWVCGAGGMSLVMAAAVGARLGWHAWLAWGLVAAIACYMAGIVLMGVDWVLRRLRARWASSPTAPR